jgi:hypothetical protein
MHPKYQPRGLSVNNIDDRELGLIGLSSTPMSPSREPHAFAQAKFIGNANGIEMSWSKRTSLKIGEIISRSSQSFRLDHTA